MSETENTGMCAIHGPGHLGKPCPDQSVENIDEVEEEYGSFDELFAVENLGDHFEEVKNQLNVIRALVEEFEDLHEKHKTDLDMDQYVDASEEKIQNAFENFTINGKKIDLRKLSNQSSFREIYNDIVEEINRYIEQYMIGKDEPLLNGI